jgi:hypothetical protein
MIMVFNNKELRQEIMEDLKDELYRGSDKTISMRTNPIRWLILHYFIGLNVIVLIYFIFEMTIDPPFPPYFMKYFTFIFPALVSITHFLIRRRKMK